MPIPPVSYNADGTVTIPEKQLECASEYAYSSLPHARSIRILELLPESAHSIPQFKVHVCDLDSNPFIFNALSYTWGNPLPPVYESVKPTVWTLQHPILCNNSLFRVTSNLYFALLKLYWYVYGSGQGRVASGRFFWIDAICINQADNAERSAQVSMMEDIYYKASVVVAWLGPDDHLTATALHYIAHLSKFPDSDCDESHAWTFHQTGVPGAGGHALLGFFMRSWFSRAWIIQEVVLASRVVLLCGDYQFDWDAVARCSRFLSSCILPFDMKRHMLPFLTQEQALGTGHGMPLGGMPHLIARLKAELQDRRVTEYMFLNFISATRGCGATDPRDLLYSVLGLLKKHWVARVQEDMRALIPRVDYSKSVAAVFTDSAILNFKLSAGLTLMPLSWVGDRSKESLERVGHLPSWVADLTSPPTPPSLIPISPGMPGAETSPSRLWNPCDNYNDNLADIEPTNGRFLRLQGALFDTITKLSVRIGCWDYFSWADVLEAFRSQWAMSISGTTFMDALWRTVIANLEKLSSSTPAGPHHGQGFAEMLLKQATGGGSSEENQRLIAMLMQALRESERQAPMAPEEMHQCISDLRGATSPGKTARNARIEAYENIMESVCGNRRLFLTEGQYLGIGSGLAEVGDQVWVFPGSMMPYILRPGTSGRFTLVGEAYVHGIMYGEAGPTLAGRYRQIELE